MVSEWERVTAVAEEVEGVVISDEEGVTFGVALRGVVAPRRKSGSTNIDNGVNRMVQLFLFQRGSKTALISTRRTKAERSQQTVVFHSIPIWQDQNSGSRQFGEQLFDDIGNVR